MYEILHTYQLFPNQSEKVEEIRTFHICEHPGMFIHAIIYYVENVTKKKHDFVFQSLKPGNNPKIFKPDKELVSKHRQKLDYGPYNGDITKPESVIYYYNKYKDDHFHLITSDCGLDCSSDFSLQEDIMFNVIYGALITAIALSKLGSNYVFKFFSFNNKETINMLQLCSLFYERVDIVRTLTTKSGSGENYCVCLNYNYDGDKETVVKLLVESMKNPDKYICQNINKKFMKKITKFHKIITLRRLTSFNSLIFRINNFNYALSNYMVIKYVENLTKYYTKYFIDYIKLNKKKDSKSLVGGVSEDELTAYLKSTTEKYNSDKRESLNIQIAHLLYEDILVERYINKYIRLKFDFDNNKKGGYNNKYKGGGNVMSHDQFLKNANHFNVIDQINSQQQINYIFSKNTEMYKLCGYKVTPSSIKEDVKYNCYILNPNYYKSVPKFIDKHKTFTNILNNIKSENVIIFINLKYKEYDRNMDIVIEYIKHIIKHNVEKGGEFILISQLMFVNEKYYNFINYLISKHSKITMSLTKLPLKVGIRLDISFTNFSESNKNPVDSEQILDFYKSINNYVYEETLIEMDINKIKFHSQFLYQTIMIKLMTIV